MNSADRRKKDPMADPEVVSLLIGLHDDLKQALRELREREARDNARQTEFRQRQEGKVRTDDSQKPVQSNDMNTNGFQVLKRVAGWKTQLTGASQAKAFAGAAALPEQEVSLDLELVARACDGYQLRFRARTNDVEVAAGDSYHLSPLAAEEAAAALFGVSRNDWETLPVENQLGAVPARPDGASSTKPPLPQRR